MYLFDVLIVFSFVCVCVCVGFITSGLPLTVAPSISVSSGECLNLANIPLWDTLFDPELTLNKLMKNLPLPPSPSLPPPSADPGFFNIKRIFGKSGQDHWPPSNR